MRQLTRRQRMSAAVLAVVALCFITLDLGGGGLRGAHDGVRGTFGSLYRGTDAVLGPVRRWVAGLPDAGTNESRDQGSAARQRRSARPDRRPELRPQHHRPARPAAARRRRHQAAHPARAGHRLRPGRRVRLDGDRRRRHPGRRADRAVGHRRRRPGRAGAAGRRAQRGGAARRRPAVRRRRARHRDRPDRRRHRPRRARASRSRRSTRPPACTSAIAWSPGRPAPRASCPGCRWAPSPPCTPRRTGRRTPPCARPRRRPPSTSSGVVLDTTVSQAGSDPLVPRGGR